MFLKTFLLLLLFTLIAPQVGLAPSVTKTPPVPEISRHARFRSLDQLGGENFSVGMMTRTFTDEKRKNWQGTGPRPLRTAVWYSAQSGTGEMETIFGGPSAAQLFSPITVAGGAELSRASQKYPLVLLSHGTGGSAVMMMWLGHYLAGRGYIVAAVNHHGNTASERQPAAQGFLLFWERARDLTAVLDKLLTDPVFGARIDQNRIGAAGFSLGGYTGCSARVCRPIGIRVFRERTLAYSRVIPVGVLKPPSSDDTKGIKRMDEKDLFMEHVSRALPMDAITKICVQPPQSSWTGNA